MDKNVVGVVEKSLPFDPPNSAGAVFQFLSKHPKKLGVRIDGAFSEPVLRVRQHEPRELDSEGRKAWSFHLFNMQERLVGTADGDKARREIEALFKADRLKLSVGTLLGLLPHLMQAEQARLAGANSYVRRWLANEKAALQLAVPHDPDSEDRLGESRDKAALMTACQVLAKFSDGENGEIETDKIRSEAFEIGRGLTREELNAVSSARMKLISKGKLLEQYIGPEAQLLLSLCLTAHGKEKSEFLSDESTKKEVSLIATVLTARTDINEYPVPTSPRTVAGRTVPRRGSMPVFYERETTATSTTTSSTASLPTSQAGSGEARTTPPANSPPSTPRRGSPDTAQDGQPKPTLVPATPVTPGGKTYGRAAIPGLNMGAAIHELTTRQQHETETATATATVSRSPLSAPLGSPPVTPRSQPFPPSSAASASTSADSSTMLTKPSKTPSGRKRMEKIDRSDLQNARQKSDGSDSSSHRARVPKPSRRAKSMVSAEPGSSDYPDAADQKALSDARDAARALKADQIKPRFDSAIYKKWLAVEQQLGAALTPETGASIQRLLVYCHEVNLEPGSERSSLDRVIRMVRPQVKDRNAYVAVRDMLLAETRGAATTGTTGSFPELLSLLVYALDAEHAWRQGHKAKSSH